MTFSTSGAANAAASITNTGNNLPSVSAGSNYVIPAATPFYLTATGSDPDAGDTLTYCWEQINTGSPQSVDAGDDGSSPLFRSWSPTTDAYRYFPRWGDVVDGSPVVGETLPTTNRYLDFAVTVRDNRAGGGGIDFDTMYITVENTGSSFAVTSPNSAVSWPVGSTQTVSWNVAGTNAGSINASSVLIGLIADGVSYTLAAETANDGSHQITVPDILASAARIYIQPVGNIFYDISDTNFSIVAGISNSPPIITNPGNRSNSEGDSVSLQLSASDPDGDALTWNASGLPSGLSINATTGLITGTLAYDDAGSYTVSVSATDGALSDSESFTWTVANTNRAPVVNGPGNQSDAEGDAVSLQLSASDPDGDALTWNASGLPSGLSFNTTTGLISGTLAYDESGSYSVQVSATDGELSDTAVFTWTVANTNRSPVVSSPGNQSDAEGDSVSLQLSGSDPDGQTLTWNASGLPSGLSIDSDTGLITGTLAYDESGSYGVSVSATDGELSDTASFTWAITNTNRAPVVSGPGNQSDAEGDSVSLQLSASDPDGDSLTWNASGLPSGLSIDSDTGLITGTLGFDASGSHAATVTVTDGSVSASTSFTWTVANTNRAPVVISPGDQNDAEGDAVSLQLSASDSDGDSLTWTASDLPTGLSINTNTGLITGTLAYDELGSYSVQVSVTDGELSDSQSFTWTVANTNRAPVISGSTFSVAEYSADGTLVGTLAATDADDDALTYSIASNIDPDGDGNAAFRIEGDQLVVNDADDLDYESNPQLVFTVQVSDGTLTDSAQITVELADANEAPVFNDQAFLVSSELSDGDPVGTLAATDVDGDALSYSFAATVDPDGDGNATFRIEGDQLLVNDADELIMAAGHAFPELEGWYVLAGDGDAIPIIEASAYTIRIESASNRYVLLIEDADDFDYDARLTATRLYSGKLHIEYEIISSTIHLHTLYDENNIAVLSGIGGLADVVIERSSAFDAFALEILATESNGNLSDAAIVTVEINRPPVFEDHVFSIDAHAAEDTLVGNLLATDADGDAVAFSVEDADYDGDGNAAFRVEGDQLVVNDAGDLQAWGTGGQDFDADGVPDRVDNAPNIYNSDQEDFDGDGIGDIADAYPMEAAVRSSWGYNLGGEEYAASAALDDIVFQAGRNAIPDQGWAKTTTVASGTGDDDLFNQLRFTFYEPLNLQIPVPTVGAEYQVTFYVAHPVGFDRGKQDVFLEGVTAVSAWETGDRIEAADYGTDDPRPLVRTATVVVNDGVLDVQITPTAGWYAQFDYVMLSAIRIDELQSAAQVTGIQLTATASDGKHTDSAQISVKVNPTGSDPVFNDQSFSVPENSVAGTVIGALVATDADGDALTYSIASNVDPDGDGNGAFRLEGDQLVVNDAGDLDYEANPQLVITAEASDGSLTDTAQITVNVTDVDEIPVITLLGDSPYVLEASSTGSYSDPGATAWDAEDGNISGAVEVSGQVVNLSVPDTYVIDYNVEDSEGNQATTVSRTVIVQDSTAPQITLAGSAEMFIEAGFPYTDAGATVSDSLDGDISGSLVVSGDVVDAGTTGSYTVLYNAQDTAGNAADQVTRTVTVQDTLPPIIALTYSGEVLQVSDQTDTGLGGQANAPSGVPSETSLGAVGRCRPVWLNADYRGHHRFYAA